MCKAALQFKNSFLNRRNGQKESPFNVQNSTAVEGGFFLGIMGCKF